MKGRSTRVVLALACGLALSSTLLPAKKKGEGKPKDSAGATHVAVEIFIGKDQELIREHYQKYPGQLPPGLAKGGGDLPPGLEKQLQRNGRLPPGLQKKLTPFPIDLERQLSPLKEGLKRGIVGGHAVIYKGKNQVVVDVFALL